LVNLVQPITRGDGVEILALYRATHLRVKYPKRNPMMAVAMDIMIAAQGHLWQMNNNAAKVTCMVVSSKHVRARNDVITAR
jgi:hypothetical protein